MKISADLCAVLGSSQKIFAHPILLASFVVSKIYSFFSINFYANTNADMAWRISKH